MKIAIPAALLVAAPAIMAAPLAKNGIQPKNSSLFDAFSQDTKWQKCTDRLRTCRQGIDQYHNLSVFSHVYSEQDTPGSKINTDADTPEESFKSKTDQCERDLDKCESFQLGIGNGRVTPAEIMLFMGGGMVIGVMAGLLEHFSSDCS